MSPLAKKAGLTVATVGVLLAVNFVMVNGVGGYGIVEYYVRILTLVGVSMILAVSLDLINGCAGQFSIGHAGFMAVGAYSAAYFTHYFGGALMDAVPGVPLWVASSLRLLLALAVGALTSGLAGLVVGVPSLRLKGDYLAIVTLGFSEIIRIVILNIDAVGGALGFSSIAQGPDVEGKLPDQRFAEFLSRSIFFWVFLFVAVTVVIVGNLANSSFGRALTAIRENEIAAEAMGVNTTRYKVTAFTISAALTGVAGGLFAHYDNYLNPSSFTFIRSVEIVIMIVLGGLGSVSGALLGATILTVLPELLRDLPRLLPETLTASYPALTKLPDYRMVIYSLLLIALMIVRPQGLLGRQEFSWSRFIKR
jgi:branched-chain amino acid transport system permease protein